MNKKLLATLIVWSLIFVPLARLSVAQQTQQPPGQQQDKKKTDKKEEKKGILGGVGRGLKKAADKTVDVAKDPQKAINEVKAWAAGGKRSWTDQQKREANEAQALFSSPDSRQVDAAGVADGSIYNPNNAAAAKAMVTRVETLSRKYRGKKRLTAAQTQEISNAIMPFARAAGKLHLDSAYFKPVTLKPDATGKITIPPHTEVSLGLRVNCEDIGASAPQAGEKMHLVRQSSLLPDEFEPIFAKLAVYSQNHPEAQEQVQRIVWNMRHGCFREWDQGKALRLQPADNALLDELSPGAAKIIKDKCHKFNVANFSKDLLAASLDGGARIDINPVGLVDANQTTLRVVNAHAHIPVTEPIPDDNSDFSLIEPGVAAQSHHDKAGASETKITIRNTTDKPFELTPSEFALESRRPVQRLVPIRVGSGNALIIGGVIVAAVILAVLLFRPFLAFFGEGFIARFLAGGALEEGAIGEGIAASRMIATSVDELIATSVSRAETSTLINIERSGGMARATQEFEALNPAGIVERGNGLRTGTLPDGRTVGVRPFSKTGPPTIQIDPLPGSGAKTIKIRYP